MSPGQRATSLRLEAPGRAGRSAVLAGTVTTGSARTPPWDGLAALPVLWAISTGFAMRFCRLHWAQAALGTSGGLSRSTSVVTAQRSVSEPQVSLILRYWEELGGHWNGAAAPDRGSLLPRGCSHAATLFLPRASAFKVLKQHQKSRRVVPAFCFSLS